MVRNLFNIQLLFILLASSSWAKRISFTDCGKGEVKWVDVSPCDNEPCMFKKGTNVTMIASIIANQDTETASLEVTVDILGIPVDYPGIDSNLCDKVSCPIVTGKQYEATYVIFADDYFPSLKTEMTWDATGSAGNMFCAKAMVGIDS
ncbi:Mite group 2 allergen Gly d 2.02 [Halotydeus destructor]|nr:Mite group 2 allergen Gly d 2.02 [Halotydeus destructor]